MTGSAGAMELFLAVHQRVHEPTMTGSAGAMEHLVVHLDLQREPTMTGSAGAMEPNRNGRRSNL